MSQEKKSRGKSWSEGDVKKMLQIANEIKVAILFMN